MRGLVLFILSALIISLSVFSNKPSESVSLFGVKLVIDPGHGGKDNGTCYQNVLEDELNLQVAEKLMNICLDEGAISSLTRMGDYDLASLYAPNRKREDLKARVDYINNSGADLFVSLHMNSFPQNLSVHGPMVYYDKNKEQSKLLAESINNSLNEFSKLDKKIRYDDFYLFRNTTIPGVLVECGFISNNGDRNNLLKEDYQNKLAQAIYVGIDGFLAGTKL